jgi:hypothetical protein
LSGDDAIALKLGVDIIYSSIMGVVFSHTDVNLDSVINKYNLAGVRNIINCSLEKE